MRKIFCVVALALISLAPCRAIDLTKSISGDYTGKADTLNYCFIENFLNKNTGTFWSTPQDVAGSSWNIYWQQAHAIDVIIYAYERLKDSDPTTATTYKNYIRKWYTNYANNYYGKTFENPFTDDMAWICLTLLHMGEALETERYTNMAKTVYDKYIITRASSEGGLHLPWNSDKNDDGTYKNADGGTCTEGPACLVAAKLYLEYGDENYLQNAKDFYSHMIEAHCYDDGRVGEPPLSYTNGTFGEACRYLYHITGETEYRDKAALFIYYAFNSTRNGQNGILRNEGENMDNSIFKAVLIPYAVNFVLDEDMSDIRRKYVLLYIQKNADSLWERLDKSKYPEMYCPFGWAETYDYDSSTSASMGAMASGASLYENTVRMHNTLIERDAATGIEPLTDFDKTVEDGNCYNIAGQKVSSDYKGLIIRNGKKVIKR